MVFACAVLPVKFRSCPEACVWLFKGVICTVFHIFESTVEHIPTVNTMDLKMCASICL